MAMIYLKQNKSTREPDYNTSLILNGNKILQSNILIRPIYPVTGTTRGACHNIWQGIHQANIGKHVELKR